jgi:uncharacterized protein YndB with AHSA1/START domain
MNPPATSLTIVRVVKASVDDVYAAWTDPNIMRQWLATDVSADVREGGRYRIESRDAGAVYTHVGEYQILEPGRRIRQTFSHVGSPIERSGEFIEVSLRPLGPALTELTLTHGWSGPAMSDEESGSLEQGWNDWLDLLDTVFVAA